MPKERLGLWFDASTLAAVDEAAYNAQTSRTAFLEDAAREKLGLPPLERFRQRQRKAVKA